MVVIHSLLFGLFMVMLLVVFGLLVLLYLVVNHLFTGVLLLFVKRLLHLLFLVGR